MSETREIAGYTFAKRVAADLAPGDEVLVHDQGHGVRTERVTGVDVGPRYTFEGREWVRMTAEAPQARPVDAEVWVRV